MDGAGRACALERDHDARSERAADQDRALQVARRMATGRVAINGAPFQVSLPTGGYKQSGNGRELGAEGLREFLEIKTLLIPEEAQP